MRDQLRLVAWLLMVTGGLILLVSAFADPLALGMPGSSFGMKQAAGCVLGALIAFGGWRFHRRLDRADARDRERARQQRATQVQAQAQAQAYSQPQPAAAAPAPAPAPAYAEPAAYAPVASRPAATPGEPERPTSAGTTPTSAPTLAPAPDIRSDLASTRAMADTAELPRGVVRETPWDDEDDDFSAPASAASTPATRGPVDDSRAAEVARAQAAARAARERQLQRARERDANANAAARADDGSQF